MSTFEIIYQSIIASGVIASNIVAITVYRRNKRIELENSLFKSRLEAIGNIQMELTIYLQQLDKTKVLIRHIGRFTDDKLFELSMELDNQIYKCEASIVKNAAYFSDSTAKKLMLFAENFYEQHKGITKEWQEGLDMYENFIRKSVTEVITHLRMESGIGEVHNSLIERYRRN